MVRRVGFGSGGAGRSERPKPPVARGPRRHADRSGPSRRRRSGALVLVAILGLWMVGWAIGIAVVAAQILTQPQSDPFVYLWLGIAALAWLFGIRVLGRLLRGLLFRPD